MKKEFENIDDVLGKYLAGEASEGEIAFVRQWIDESLENKAYLNQLDKIYRTASSLREKKEYDTDAAWQKVRANLKQHGSVPVIPISTYKPNVFAQWWRVAAAVLLLSAVAINLFRSSETVSQPIEVVANKTAISDTLPDGSNVFLNKETKVVYAYDKKTNTHDVKLRGEAYFSIKHNKREQFVIDAGNVFIKDIGTSFNVKAYPGSDLVEVVVEEGEIIFFTAENPGIRLKESGKAIYNKKTKQFTIDEPDPNITAYKTKFFVFSHTDLAGAVESLNNVYDKTIVVPAHLANCPITVTFKDETIEEIVEVLAETLNLTVTREEGKLILNGKGCE